MHTNVVAQLYSVETDKAKDTNAEELTIGKLTLRCIFSAFRGSRENLLRSRKMILAQKLKTIYVKPSPKKIMGCRYFQILISTNF